MAAALTWRRVARIKGAADARRQPGGAMIPASGFHDQLLTRVDIVDVVERYVPLKKPARTTWPAARSIKEKAIVLREPQQAVFITALAAAHGNAIRFVMEHAGLGFIDAVNELAASVGMSVPQAPASPQQQQAARQRPSCWSAWGRGARVTTVARRSPGGDCHRKTRLTGEIAARLCPGLCAGRLDAAATGV